MAAMLPIWEAIISADDNDAGDAAAECVDAGGAGAEQEWTSRDQGHAPDPRP